MMRLRSALLAVMLAILCSPGPASAQPFTSRALTSATCPGTGCAVIQVDGQGSVGVQITGTFTGTITFEQSIDGTNYVTLAAIPNTLGATVTTTTTIGLWTAPIAGARWIRIRFSAYTSGTATVSTVTTTTHMWFRPGGDGTVPTGVATGSVFASNGIGAQGAWSASPPLTSVNVTGLGALITKSGARFIHTYFDPTSDGNNTFIGLNAGNLTMGPAGGASYLGSYNTAVGYQALFNNTTGYYNTATGVNALYSNTTGYSNTAAGFQALFRNTTGYSNTAVGYQALTNNSVGYSNTAVGLNALYSNTTGYTNAAVGYQALFSNTTGYSNTAVGFQAGYTATPANANVSGTDLVFLGYNSGPGTATQLSNAIAIGSGALVSTSNTAVLGNASITSTILRGTVSVGTALAVGTNPAGGTNPIRLAGNGLGGLTWRNFNNTADIGQWQIVAVGRVTAQSAANASIATFTTPAADGSYEVSANMNVTASTTLVTTLTCTYTDESNTARSMVLPVSSLSGSFIAAGAITGAGATVWETPVMHIRVKASTAITILTSAGTFTGVTYTAEGIIKQTQ